MEGLPERKNYYKAIGWRTKTGSCFIFGTKLQSGAGPAIAWYESRFADPKDGTMLKCFRAERNANIHSALVSL
jgi:hypothetical protein